MELFNDFENDFELYNHPLLLFIIFYILVYLKILIMMGSTMAKNVPPKKLLITVTVWDIPLA